MPENAHPTGHWDRKSAEEILDLRQALPRRFGKTMLPVAHDPKTAAPAAVVLPLGKGVLVEAYP